MFFDVTHPLLFAFFLPHGLTDLWTVPPHLLFPYLSLLLPPSSLGGWDSPLFLAASVYHLSGDVGVFGSSLLHAFWMERLLRGRDALGWATLYLSLVHTPLHYWNRLVANPPQGRVKRVTQAVSLSVSTAACLSLHNRLFLRLSSSGSTLFRLTPLRQRVVVSHVLVEDFLSEACREGGRRRPLPFLVNNVDRASSRTWSRTRSLPSEREGRRWRTFFRSHGSGGRTKLPWRGG